jgi:conserved domain protein (fragment)
VAPVAQRRADAGDGHAGSNKKVWWQCSMGHVWKSVIYPRTGAQQCGCPVCAGKVSTTHARRYAQLDEIHTFTEL